MNVNEILTKEDLLAYLNKHPTPKNNVIGALINKCEELLTTNYNIASFIYNHSFFQKKEKVLGHCAIHNKQNIISGIINIGIQNLDIVLLSEIDKWFTKREDEISEKLFSKELTVFQLFDCLVYSDKTSKIFIKAKDKIEKLELSENELILLLNSFNKIIYGIQSSIKITFLKDYFESEFISNSVWRTQRLKPELKPIRISFLKKALIRLQNSWKLVILIDFIIEDDLEKINEYMEPNVLSWLQLDYKLADQMPFPEVCLFDFNEDDEYYPEMDFSSIWEKFESASNSVHLIALFELLILKIFLIEKEVIANDLDFKKLLDNTLTAYYIKALHDLSILNKIPMMHEVFDWPHVSLTDVELYLGRFEKQFYDESPLKKLGYRVGKSSKLTMQERQYILRKAFESVPATNLEPYKWGAKKSPSRLESLAKHLINQINNFRRIRTRNYTYAIQDWESDLEFLKSKFYDNKFADEFIWPYS